MSGYTEHAFEMAIEVGLTSVGGYEKRSQNVYDEAQALFPAHVTGLLSDSQPARWQALEALFGSKTGTTVLDNLSKKLEREGTLNKERIETTIAAHLSIGAPPARCIRFETRSGPNRFDG